MSSGLLRNPPEYAIMLATAKLKYVAESERGFRRYLDVTLLDGWPYQRAPMRLSESARES